jgi:integrase
MTDDDNSDLAPDLEFLAEGSLSALNPQQQILYAEFWDDFIDYLRNRAKFPERNVGYSADSIRPMARRVHQAIEYYWDDSRTILQLAPDMADDFLQSMVNAEITTNDDERYSANSIRKFKNALAVYFQYLDRNWEPTISFGTEQPHCGSDPYNRREREILLNSTFDYQSPPTYSNVSPEERDRWKGQIAQIIGKPKEDVSPDDWEELKTAWKVPSIISTTLDGGLRAKLVERLDRDHLDLDNGRIIVPPDIAVKNNQRWEIELSERSIKLLEKWCDRRDNRQRYDSSNALWLNRKGNRYDSKNLNNLLRNLMQEGGIEPQGRTLTWHSIRHSTGMYVYDQERDLGLVAEVLRHSSLEAAKKYAHPTPEAKRDVIESIQGGGVPS